jgi:hypothetical protein
MTASDDLERGYRRLLAWYPRGFRRENEQELLTVLMAGAAAGQRRPRLAESDPHHTRARVAFGAFFAFFTLALLADVGQHLARYDPAVLAVATAIWLVGLASTVLIFIPKSGPYYRAAVRA